APLVDGHDPAGHERLPGGDLGPQVTHLALELRDLPVEALEHRLPLGVAARRLIGLPLKLGRARLVIGAAGHRSGRCREHKAAQSAQERAAEMVAHRGRRPRPGQWARTLTMVYRPGNLLPANFYLS